MKRSLLLSLCAVLLAGCDPADRSLVAVAVDKASADPNTDTNAVAVAAPVIAPTPPPELPAPAQEVVRLAQTSLGETVLVNYIATIRQPFKLNAEQIIYLHDLGIPESAIQALIKQEQTFPDTAQGPMLATQPTNRQPITPFVAPPPTQNTVAAAMPVDLAAPPPADGATQVIVEQPIIEVNDAMFYDSLTPYGVWVEVAGFGRCWQPTVALINPGWRPYCDDGYWVWSDCGWYWRSHYSWGWAPFHYGRWQLASGRGWCWVPDHRWGPAWVTWRSGGEHCGWAPLPPGSGWSVGVGLTWGGRRAGPDCDFGLGFNHFVYLGWNRFTDPRPWRYCEPRSEVAAIYHGSRPINDIHGGGNINIVGNHNTVIINNGPGLKPVQAHTRTEIPKVRIVDSPDVVHTLPVRSPGQPGGATPTVLPVYRPNLTATAASAVRSTRPVPSAPVPRREEPGGGNATVFRPTAPSVSPLPSVRATVVGSTRGQSRPPLVEGFPTTASTVPRPLPVTRSEAPVTTSGGGFAAHAPVQNVQPAPAYVGTRTQVSPGAAATYRPNPTYNVPPAPVYRPAISQPTPVYRNEPARVQPSAPMPTYNVPSRPSSIQGPAYNGNTGNGGNNGHQQQQNNNKRP